MSPAIPGSSTRKSAISHGLNQPRSHLARHRSPAVGIVGALFALLAISACGGSHVNAQSGPTAGTSTPATPTTSSSAHGPTPREAAAAAATAQVRHYEAVLDELSIHADASLNRLNAVATEPNLAQEVGSLNRFREARDRQAGLSKITRLRVDRMRLPAAGTHVRHSIATAHISLCLDVAHVRAYGPSGHSIVPKSRKPYFLTSLTLVNRDYPSPSAWLVSNRTDREVDQCAL
jgi:hypothetical protein